MMNWWKPILSLLIILLSGLQLLAQEESVYAVPVEWQKVELQKLIEEDLTRSIRSLVDATKFLVQVSIQINESKTIPMAEKEKAAGQEAFPLAKLGINKESKAYKKAITVTQNSIFSRLKSVSVDVAIDATVTKAQESQVQILVNKIMKKYSEGARLTLSRMNFINSDEHSRSNVEAAKTLATGLSEAMAKGNDKIAEALNQSNDKIAQAIAATANVKLPDTKDGKPESAFPGSWQELVVLFKLPLGIIVATILLIIFISGFKSIENKKVALMASAAQAAQASGGSGRAVETVEAAPAAEADTKSGETGSGATAQGGGVAVASGSGQGADSGFGQFKKMSEQYAETAAFLIKTWINIDTTESREALAVLTKMIPVDVLVPVISQLDDALKGRFKKASMEPLDAGSIARADSFIIEQMVENFLVNTIVLSEGLRTVLSGMTMDECLECIQRDTQYGVCFMNVLQTPHVARLLSALPQETADQLITEGINFSPELIGFLESNLPSVLADIRQTRKTVRVPLVDKSIELIKLLGPDRESKIFDMLVNSGDHELVVEATNRYFPAELILLLPADVLKILLGKMPTKQRAILIYSRPSNEQTNLFAAIGDKGRLREVIDSEIDEIKKDKKQIAQIEKDKGKIWEQFVVSARQTIKTNDNVQDSAKTILNQWLEKKGIGTSVAEVVNRAA